LLLLAIFQNPDGGAHSWDDGSTFNRGEKRFSTDLGGNPGSLQKARNEMSFRMMLCFKNLHHCELQGQSDWTSGSPLNNCRQFGALSYGTLGVQFGGQLGATDEVHGNARGLQWLHQFALAELAGAVDD